VYRKYLPRPVERGSSTVARKAPAAEHAPGARIVLLNWNIHKNNPTRRWQEDFAAILHRYRPDLIAFQEYQTHRRKSVLDHHPEYGYAFAPNMVWHERHFGLLNAARYPIDDVAFYLSEGVEPIIQTPKTVLETRYRMAEGTPLRLINVHMINFVRLRIFTAQLEQIASALAQDTAPVILTGDFNTWNTARLRRLERLTHHHGLQPVRFEQERHRKAPFPHPLDHIFYRQLHPLRSEVLTRITTSDHKPMVVTFRTDAGLDDGTKGSKPG